MIRKKTTSWFLVFGAIVLIVAVVLWDILAASSSDAQSQQPVYHVEFAMDTVVEFELYGPNAQQAIDEICDQLHQLESLISAYLPESEIAQINANAGVAPVQVSDITFSYLQRAKQLSALSNGCFDITIGPLTALWQITADDPQVPEHEQILQALQLVDYCDLQLDESQQTAMLQRAGQRLDLGGIAKGLACAQVRQTAQQHQIQAGFISLGGNLVVLGDPPAGQQRFGIRHPRGEQSDILGTVDLTDTVMATSGDYERYFFQDSKRYHHLLDPKTGYPANNGLISVTVICEDGGLADFLSTTLFVAGKQVLLEHLAQDDYALIAVDDSNNVYLSEQLRESFTPNWQTGYRYFVGEAQDELLPS